MPTFDVDAEEGGDLRAKLWSKIMGGPMMKDLSTRTPSHFILPWLTSSALHLASATRHSPAAASTVFTFTVQDEYLNASGGQHGGWTATVMDMCTSMTVMLLSRRGEGFWTSAGTTRTLNCTYLRPPKVGEGLRLECETVHVGRRLCLIRGTLKRAKDGAVIATCEHNKYNVDADAAKL